MTVAGSEREGSPDVLASLARRARVDPNSVLLALGLAVMLAIPVVPGKLQVGTAVCIALIPLLVGRVPRTRLIRLLSGSLLLWAAGQIVSDEVNGLGLRLSLTFVLALTILAVALCLLYTARGDYDRIRQLAIGVALSGISSAVVLEHVPIGDPRSWKFAFNTPAAVALLALTDLAWIRGRRLPSLLALIAVCGVGLWSDNRGLTGIALLTLVSLVVLPRSHQPGHPKLFFAIASLGLLLGALSKFFLGGAANGDFGDRSAGQVQRFGANPLSIMVNVRPELYQELGLFLQRPLTGFGSIPALSSSNYYESLQLLKTVGVRQIEGLSDNWLRLSTPGVSAHSMAVDTWVRAGILAVPFWIILLVLALRAGVSALGLRSSPLLIMWTMIVIWDFFFSPLTVDAAILLAAYISLAVVNVMNDNALAASLAAREADDVERSAGEEL